MVRKISDGKGWKGSAAESVSPAEFPAELRVLLRILGCEDDEFIRTHHADVAKFRSDRRKAFRMMIPRLKRYFQYLEQSRRTQMRKSGQVNGSLMVADSFVYSRALLEIRLALLLHYVAVTPAARLVQFACAEIEACLSVSETSMRELNAQT